MRINELRKKSILTPNSVYSIWLQHNMESSQKRMKALSTEVEQKGIILEPDGSIEKSEKKSRLTGR